MPVHKIVCGVEGVDPVAVALYWAANKYAVIQWQQLTGTREENSAFIVDALQAFFDVRVRLNTFALSDPERIEDPDLPYYYWSDEDGTKNPSGKYITTRVIEVTGAPWNPDNLSYDVRLRRLL